MSSQRTVYKYCIVPQCTNTTITTPNKIFIYMPKDEKTRKKWCNAMRRDPKKNKPLSSKSTRYCCEDHFELKEESQDDYEVKLVNYETNAESMAQNATGQEDGLPSTSSKVAERISTNTYSVCRICLSIEGLLLSIPEPLQRVYEKLTDYALHADGKPIVACFICYAQLNKCRKLMLTSARAENELNLILKRNYKITARSVSQIDRKAKGLSCPLIQTKPECFDNLPEPVVVKTELGTEFIGFETQLGTEVRVDIKTEFVDNQTELGTEIVDVKTEPDYVEVDLMPTELEPDVEDLKIVLESEVTGVDIKTEIFNEPSHPVPVSDVGDDIGDMDSDDVDRTSEAQLCDVREIERRKKDDEKDVAPVQKSTTAEQNEAQKKTNKTQIDSKQDPNIHTSEKRYGCTICQQRFKMPSDLSKHILIHSGEKPYECDVCHRKYRRSSHMKRHFLTHTGEKPHKCKFCKKQFKRIDTMTKHLDTHTGVKPYICDVCLIRFNQKGHLKRHLRIHTGEKPYECDVCAQRFNHKSSLVGHIKTHSGEILGM